MSDDNYKSKRCLECLIIIYVNWWVNFIIKNVLILLK